MPQNPTRRRRRYVPAVGPKLMKVLFVVFGLFALLAINSTYLSGITIAEWITGETYQDYFYQVMFLVHLALGLVIILPVVIYGAIHISNAHDRPNRRAVKVGYALFTTALVLLASGLVLTRGLPLVEIRHPQAREVAYWLHVITPLVAIWLFVLHRLAGKRINWRVGLAVSGFAGIFAVGMLVLQAQDPRRWNVAGPASGEQYFFPSLARTATGNFIPAETLMMDGYCVECHADVYEKWSHSMHRFASFNNPAYLFSVTKTREFSMAQDGDVQRSRFCAGCHDVVPFFSGAFDDPNFDMQNHPTAQAGITCTSCHAITHVNSPRGNADYTIEEPLHYPFAFSENEMLQWVNRTLVKAKPDFHKKTFLKDLHRTPEFCGTCHKVHLAEEFNGYKWLRGQNHYDSYHLSGVSGHGITSFYYPPEAEHNCNGCHMPAEPSTDFGARVLDESGVLKVHDHQFAAANTAIPHLLDFPEWVYDAHRELLEGSLRVDIFGLKRGGTIDGELIAPLRPKVPAVEPGERYLLETVVRTLELGHPFTQGTADSNQVWLEVTLRADGRVVGRSGGMEPTDGSVDPWSHFVNVYMLDRDGNRVDRRNPEDIFTPLYNHQIPPGAADVIHYAFDVPRGLAGPIEAEVKLQYRKFDTRYMRHFQAEDFDYNDLPIVTIAEDSVLLPIAGGAAVEGQAAPDFPLWQRWNDYGIGLLRKGDSGELRQAEEAFARVQTLDRPEGPLNTARVYIREGRLGEAVAALQRASSFDPPAPPWSVTYFTGQVNMQNGFLDEAIANFRAVAATQWQEAHERGFDFSQDYRLLSELGLALFERAKLERGATAAEARNALLKEAAGWFEKALALEPENAEAHYALSQVFARLGRDQDAAAHQALHEKYRVDDNASDRAIALARSRDDAADHAADAIVIYDLQRQGAYELPAAAATLTQHEDRLTTRADPEGAVGRD
ncbi:MAG: multiheme c-type cytochrome [Gammaproteobacteria bacterium]